MNIVALFTVNNNNDDDDDNDEKKAKEISDIFILFFILYSLLWM